MRAQEIQLIAPSGSRITGFLTKSGETCALRCLFSRVNGNNHFFYEIPDGMLDEIDINYADRICVDEGGKCWTLGDVEWESAPSRA